MGRTVVSLSFTLFASKASSRRFTVSRFWCSLEPQRRGRRLATQRYEVGFTSQNLAAGFLTRGYGNHPHPTAEDRCTELLPFGVPSIWSSISAVNIVSQWLELRCQDMNGHLAALRCSKNRVHAVFQTDLAFLMSEKFSSNQENGECLENVLEADVYRARWSALFDHMENALSEEEKQLEYWLKALVRPNQRRVSFLSPLLDRALFLTSTANVVYNIMNIVVFIILNGWDL